MILKHVTIAVFFAAFTFAAAPTTAQTDSSTPQSGADFGAGSTQKKPDESSSSSTAETPEKTPDESSTSPVTETSEKTPDEPSPSSVAETPKKTPDEKNIETKEAANTESTSATPVTAPEQDTPAKIPSGETPTGLTVASWGGAYTESQKRAYFTPFEEETGIAIKAVSHQGKFEKLISTPESKDGNWDIVDIDLATLEHACKDGALEKVMPSALEETKDGKPAASDFLADTLHECGIPSVAWSSAIVYDKRAFKKSKPKTAADFFDTKRFPGKRALPKNPKYILELAMMADGVKPENVYEELSSEDGLKKAFDKLDTLRDDILWWEKAHQPLKQLAKKEAALALAFNGRIFSAIVADNKPFDIIWDGQVFDLDFWAIPKGASHKAASLKFIAFATRPESLARQANWFPYGPVRKSAVNLVGKHPEVNVDMAMYIPTAPANFKRALRLNTLWWKENGERLRDRYEAWMDTTQDSTSFEDEQQ